MSGMGPGGGQGQGQGMRFAFDKNNTRGWSLMTTDDPACPASDQSTPPDLLSRARRHFVLCRRGGAAGLDRPQCCRRTQVHLYFFWTSTCTHCQAARPFVEALPARHPWLVLHSRNLTTDPNAADAYVAMAESLGQEASSVPALTLGTIALAIAANSNELLCAPGFPMIYTRLLTLSELPPWQHYAYLAFYNVVYVIPLLVITVVFTYTLGSRKLSEIEGRLLKLVSGTMMLGLGILLIAAPAVLNDLRVALVLLVGSIGLSWLVHWLRKPVQGAKNE